jgi:ABC-type transport system substrate-binding protein
VKVDIHFTDEWTRYTAMLRRGEPRCSAMHGMRTSPTPIIFLFHSSILMVSPTICAYRNPQVDRLLERAREELDYAQRVKFYCEAERTSWKMRHGLPSTTTSSSTCISLMQGVEVKLGDR